MRAIFLDDLERQFEAVIATADLLCTKEELLVYDDTPNRTGQPKRVCNPSLIYCREYKKRLRLRGTFFSGPGGARSIIRRAARAWKDLDPAQQHVFELAAQLMKIRFQRDHPTYKYQPTKKIKPQQHNMNRASADTQPNIPDEEPTIAPSSIPDEEPATAAGDGARPAMPGRGLTGLLSPGTPLYSLPHTTLTTEQNATNQSLPHTTLTTEQNATSQSLPHTTTYNNSSSSMTSPQYYYPSPGSDAPSILSSPPDEYPSSFPTPLMTPGSTPWSDSDTPDTLLGDQIFPHISDIEVVVQEEKRIPANEIEGEFNRLIATGYYDYLRTLGRISIIMM